MLKITNVDKCKHCGAVGTIKPIKREKTKKELEYEQIQLTRYQIEEIFAEKEDPDLKPIMRLKIIEELHPELTRYKCKNCGTSGKKEEMYAPIKLIPVTEEEYEKEMKKRNIKRDNP